MKICVIGAGASGLPAIKSAIEKGFKVTCFEKSNDIGGLWRYKADPCPGEGSVMRSTVINTSKEMTAYSDFPPPKEAANFMHNSELLRYFRAYAEHNDLLRYIKLEHSVSNVARAPDFDESGRWIVTYTDLTTEKTTTDIFDGVMVCTGHHTEEYWPKPFPGQEFFKGKIIHSHQYKDFKGFEDKRVIVVGIGNSGGDLCVELSKVAEKVYLATRSGTWVMNRIWDMGEPVNNGFRKSFPFWLQNWILSNKLTVRCDHGRYGLKPKHRPLEAHLTVNDELPNRIACGMVVVKPNIGSFTEDGVIFEDGTIIKADIIIFATGYSIGFPVVEEGKLIPVTENRVELYKFMYPPGLAKHNTLAVIGLIQPAGSIMPISEMQARVFTGALAGELALPGEKEMKSDIKKKLEKMKKVFVASRRHTIQVEYVSFMEELARMIGVRPKLWTRWVKDPALAFVLSFHGLAPYQYRLDGPNSWPGAREALLEMDERVFETTRTRRTKETMESRPFSKIKYSYRAVIA
ncbi:unnamed protein product, partial [Mesorhabditis belari]|uniref:Flavin-containing monooxygenase n=1 Tax=Mesorhabditis belari TaxID=2138241 RepID=A0AAF3EZ29_9BILA